MVLKGMSYLPYSCPRCMPDLTLDSRRRGSVNDPFRIIAAARAFPADRHRGDRRSHRQQRASGIEFTAAPRANIAGHAVALVLRNRLFAVAQGTTSKLARPAISVIFPVRQS